VKIIFSFASMVSRNTKGFNVSSSFARDCFIDSEIWAEAMIL
jgi:hypothetical protein